MKKLINIFLLCILHFTINAQTPNFKDGDTICFLGDSITYHGGYIAFINIFYATRYPNMNIRFHNCGFGGDVARGAKNRLDWDVLQLAPNKVAIMLGMNDVGRSLYANKDDKQAIKRRNKLLDAYKSNMKEILDKLKEKDIDVILMTPSPYDQNVYTKTRQLNGVNNALGVCAEFCIKQAKKNNYGLVEFHAPMTACNKKMQKENPKESLIGKDRVHPHMTGHMLMAYLFLKSQRVSPDVASVSINIPEQKIIKSQNCVIKNLQIANQNISFDYTAKSLPYPLSKEYKEVNKLVPFTKDLNKELLQIKGLANGEYSIFIDGKGISYVTATELSKGLNIGILNTPQQKQAQEVEKLIMKRRSLELHLRRIAYAEIGMHHSKVDLNDKNARNDYLALVAKKRKNTKHEKFYLRMIRNYKQSKPQETKIRQEIKQLTELIHKQNKPVTHKIEINSKPFVINVLGSSKFSSSTGWSLGIRDPLKKAGCSARFIDGCFTTSIPKLKKTPGWTLQLIRSIDLKPGQKYQIEFDVEAESAGEFVFRYIMHRKPYTVLAIMSFKVKQGKNKLSKVFSVKDAKAPNGCRSLRFILGTLIGKVKISNVKLIEIKEK